MHKLAVVTGGAGFIGSHLCERLVAEGYTVISLDNYFTGSKDNHVEGVEYREGHTKDIAKHIGETPDIIYHLGEYSRTATAMEEPELVFDLNIKGTLSVLEFWRKRNCKLVYAGSSTKFSAPRPGGVEAAGVEGRNLSPYTWAKAANTELVSNYAHWYGLFYANAYFSNVYGIRERGDKYGTVIARWMEKVRANEPLGVRLPGHQKRNYTHIKDTIDGLVLVGEKGEGDGYNIIADEGFGTKEVAEMFKHNIEFLPARKTSRPYTLFSNEKVKSLGWEQKHHLVDYINNFLESHE